MILRAKLTRCSSLYTLLLAIGLAFITVNIVLLWSQQQQGAPQNICVCEPSINLAKSNEIEKENVPLPKKLIDNLPKDVEVTASMPVSSEVLGEHRLAVVVPFRDRHEEMITFVPHIHRFLDRQNIHHDILVVNQVDKHRFNRAALLNIGYILSQEECDYMVMHDVDLLPLNDELKYSYPDNGPLHISSPELHPLYHYATFVGGILIMSREQFHEVNGLSNLFWGWGREDDELYIRMREKKMQVQYPQGITTGYKTFRHLHDREKRPRDQNRFFNQKEVSRKRDKKTGLNTVQYTVVSDVPVSIDGAPLRFISVELVCDYELTPFCDNPR